MIYPLQDINLIKIYKCGACKKIFESFINEEGFAFKTCGCAVVHYPGTCCHYGEKEISQKRYEKIKELI